LACDLNHCSMNYDPEEIVEFILDCFVDGMKEHSILGELQETYDIDEKSAKHAVSMVLEAYKRAGKIHAGEEVPHSKNESDKFFSIAVKMGLDYFRDND
jgi:hypothetical protein